MRPLPRLIAVTLLWAAVTAWPAAASHADYWTGRYLLNAGGRISVDNVQGSILVEAWDRAEVELTIVKTATDAGRASLDNVDVSIEPQRDWLRIQTVYPGSPEEAVVVDYRLRVPRQVHLEGLHTVNGDIVVRGIEGSLEARTLNGNIEECGSSGAVTARTLNGNVQVALRALPDDTAALTLESINGNVQLLLPADAGADLDMSTVAGRLESRLPFTARAVQGDNAARARLNRGGVSVRLRTIRGDIRVAEAEDTL